MPHEDFDIDSLAKYLHLAVPQVARLAVRGKLPGRKVSGKWRFARADIHHWLEDRIGLSNEDELQRVEDVLTSSSSTMDDTIISIANSLPVDAIAIPLNARTRGSVITAMSNLAAATGLLWDSAKMAEAVRARENLHPTALDNGVALLHPRRPMSNILAEAFLALGRTHQGVPFGGRGGLTDIFFLVCSTDDRGHLRLLARLSRLLSDANLLSMIRSSDDAQNVHQAIRDTEEILFDDKRD